MNNESTVAQFDLSKVATVAKIHKHRGRVSSKTDEQKAEMLRLDLVRDLRNQFETTKANKVGDLQVDWFRFNVKPRSNVDQTAVDDRKITGFFEARLKNGNSINLRPEGMTITTESVTAMAIEKNAEGEIVDLGQVVFNFDPSLPIPSEVIAQYNAGKNAYTQAKKDGTYTPKARGRKALKTELKAELKIESVQAEVVEDAPLTEDEIDAKINQMIADDQQG